MAGEGDAERLVVMLEARIRDFEKNMAKASGTADRSYGRMRTGSRSATRQMETDMMRSTARINQALAATSTRMGSFARVGLAGLTAGFAGALAPVLGVASALGTAKAAMNDFDRIAKQAKASGLDSDFFQELAHAAELGGMSMDELSKATSTFIGNAGLASEGKGRMVAALKQLNPELLEAIQNTTDQEQRLRLVADAIDKEADASRKAAIAKAAFGDAGIKMVEVLKGGSAALDDTARKAQELGLVVDRDLLARAEELNDEFGTATKVIDLNFKQALIDLAPFLISSAQLAGEVARAISSIVDAMRAVEDKSLSGLESELKSLRAELATRPEEDWVTGLDGNRVDLTEVLRQRIRLIEKEIFSRADKRSMAGLKSPSVVVDDDSDTPTSPLGNRAAEAAIRDAEAKLNILRESLMTEEELELTSHNKRLEQIKAFYASGAIAKEEQDSLIEAAHEQHAMRMIEIAEQQAAEEQRIREMTIDGFASLFGTLGRLAEQAGEENLAISKAFGLAQVGIKTAEGVMQALTLPPPASWAQAAAISAQGALQATTIMSASRGRSGQGAVNTPPAAAAPPTARSISFNLQGDYFSAAAFGGLLQRLQDELGVDGLELVVNHKQA